jgi:hypothetical protein
MSVVYDASQKKGFSHLGNMTLPCERFVRRCRHHYRTGSISERRRNEVKAVKRLIKHYCLRDGPFVKTDDDYVEYINEYIHLVAGPGMSRHYLPSELVDRVLRRIPDYKRTINKDLEFLSMCSVWFCLEPREE